MFEAIIEDNYIGTIACIHETNAFLPMDFPAKVPILLRGASWHNVAAFCGSIKSLCALLDIPTGSIPPDTWPEAAHFACAGGNFDIIRAVDMFGGVWGSQDRLGRMPSVYAAMFGRREVLAWLWTKGELHAALHRWGSASPDIMIAAAGAGHTEVVQFLIDEAGIAANVECDGEITASALHAACAGGHAETALYLISQAAPIALLRVLRHPAIPTSTLRISPLGDAVLSGSLNCVQAILPLVERDESRPGLLSLAVLSGHGDVLRALLGAWPDSPRREAYSLAVVLHDAGAIRCLGVHTFAWTTLVIGLLVRLPPSAMAEVCATHNMTYMVPSLFPNLLGNPVWLGVRAMLQRGAVDEDLLRAACARYGPTLRGPVWTADKGFWKMLAELGWWTTNKKSETTVDELMDWFRFRNGPN